MVIPASQSSAEASPEALPHDPVFKAIFSQEAAVQDLLVGFVGKDLPGGREWIERFDFETLEQLPTEHIGDDLRSRFNDVVWRVRFRDAAGDEEWLHVVVMLEFQSSVDWFMALRMQGYAVRLYEHMWAGRPVNRDSRLPPILGVVLYNGREPWGAATSLGDLVGAGTRPAVEAGGRAPALAGDSYVVTDLRHLPLDTLPADNAVSLLARAEAMEAAREVLDLVDDVLRVLEGPDRGPLQDIMLRWLCFLGRRLGVDLNILMERTKMTKLKETGQLRATLEERFDAWNEELRAEGRAQEVAQRIELDRARLQRLTERKFGTATAEKLAPLVASMEDPGQLEAVADWIIDCANGPELLARLQSSA